MKLSYSIESNKYLIGVRDGLSAKPRNFSRLVCLTSHRLTHASQLRTKSLSSQQALTGVKRILSAFKTHQSLHKTAHQVTFYRLFQPHLIVFARAERTSLYNSLLKKWSTATPIPTASVAQLTKYLLGASVEVSSLRLATQAKVSRVSAPMTILKRMNADSQITSTELSTTASPKRLRTLRRRFWRMVLFSPNSTHTLIFLPTRMVFIRELPTLSDSKAVISWKLSVGKIAKKKALTG